MISKLRNLTGVGLLSDGVRLDDLLDELLQARAVLLSLEHLAVDGDLGVERLQTFSYSRPIQNLPYLLGVEQHLQLYHESLALLAHLADLSVAVVESSLVGAEKFIFELKKCYL